MKKTIKQVLYLLCVLILAFFFVRQYLYVGGKPKIVGSQDFPLTEKWNVCVGDKVKEISTDGNEKIFTKTDKELSAYNLNSGELIWNTPLEGEVEPFPPISAGDKIFVLDNKNLSVFDMRTGDVLWKKLLQDPVAWIPDASEKYVLFNPYSDRVFVLDALSGKKIWETEGARGRTQAHIYHDKIFIVNYGVKVFDAISGEFLWELNNDSTTTDLSMMKNELLFFVEIPNNNSFYLVAYNTNIKKEMWRISFLNKIPNRLYVYDDVLFLYEDAAIVQINAKTGGINWMKDFSYPVDFAIADGNVYTLGNFNRIIHSLDITSGKDLGTLQISTPRLLGTNGQEMISVGENLVFSRGCEIFVYGN